MKRLTVLSILMAVCFAAYSTNTLTLSSASGHPGDTVTLTVSLANSDAVSAMQAFIPLGGQLRYVEGSATLGSRSNGHQLTASVLRDTLRIYSYSLSLASYGGTSGTILTFKLVLGNEPATYSLPLCSALLSSSTGSALTVQTNAGSVTIQAPKISLLYGTSQAGSSAYQIDYGHCPIRSSYTRTVTVRNTGNEPLSLTGITFNDATLSASPATATIAAGGYQHIPVSYQPVTAGSVILRGIFGSNARVGDSLLTIIADPYAVNELRPLSVSGYTDSIVTIQLRMNNMDSIVGLQTSIRLPSALTYIDGSFTVATDRSQGHTASAGLRGDTLTLLVTSFENRPLLGGDGVVASFQVRLHGYGYYTVSLQNTALSDAAGRNALSAVYSGSVNIYSPTLSCVSTLQMGTTSVTDTAVTLLTISNNGNAPLVIDRVQFMGARASQYFSVAESLPITINNYSNAALHVRYCGTDAGHFSATMQIYNNDPRRTLQLVSVEGERYEPNSLYMDAVDGETAASQVGVMLDNYSAVTALQMDIEYPYHYAALENGDIQTTSRSNGHFVSSARQNDSTWRILLLSMNNQPLLGNSGPVLSLQLHVNDTNDTGRYPMYMHNVMVANAAGANVLSSLDSTIYIATRQLWDTLYIHDTTVVVETEYVHDTTTLYVHDTTILTEYIHDTTVVTLWDTAYVDVFVHDTTMLYVHDTTILTEYIHDTTTVTLWDTAYIDVYIHETTYVDNYIHDTTYVDNYIHDTTYVDNWIYDTTIVFDTLWLTQYDTVWLHDTVYIHDTITVGVNNVEAIDAKVYVSNHQIVVEGADGNAVTLFDLNGRMLATRQDYYDKLYFDVPASGGYLIRIGNHPARKVVVIK